MGRREDVDSSFTEHVLLAGGAHPRRRRVLILEKRWRRRVARGEL